MQLGIFSVGDLTTDPTTGKTPTEYEKLQNTLTIAQHADELGFDVFALGEHHNPPFMANPIPTLSYLAAKTNNITLSTATTLITVNDAVELAENYATLQHLTGGRMDLVLGRGNQFDTYGVFGKDIRQGIPLAVENFALLQRLWNETNVDWKGRFRTPLSNFTSVPRPLDNVQPFVWHGSIRSPEIADQAAFYGRFNGFLHNHIFWNKEHTQQMVELFRERFVHYGHGSANEAIVGIGAQVFMNKDSQEAVRRFRPYFNEAPVYGHGPSLEDFTEQTPLTVGSPQEIIDRTLGFQEYVGPFQRLTWLIDHAGLPLKTVLEQMDMLASDVMPTLRTEFELMRPADAPFNPPTHAEMVEMAAAEQLVR